MTEGTVPPLRSKDYRPELTHHIWVDVQAHPRTWVRALCGTFIRRKDSAPHPTCAVCQYVLAKADSQAVAP